MGRRSARDSPEAASSTVTTINREILMVAEPAAPFGEEDGPPRCLPVPR